MNLSSFVIIFIYWATVTPAVDRSVNVVDLWHLRNLPKRISHQDLFLTVFNSVLRFLLDNRILKWRENDKFVEFILELLNHRTNRIRVMSKTSVIWQLGTMSAVKRAPNRSPSLANWKLGSARDVAVKMSVREPFILNEAFQQFPVTFRAFFDPVPSRPQPKSPMIYPFILFGSACRLQLVIDCNDALDNPRLRLRVQIRVNCREYCREYLTAMFRSEE